MERKLQIKQVLENLKLIRTPEVIKRIDVLFTEVLSSIFSGLYKGNGNTLETAENGDYRIIINTDGALVAQYRTNGDWDTDNETIVATPS